MEVRCHRTLEICYLDCAVTSDGSPTSTAIVDCKIIQSDCIMMVTEDDLQFVPVFLGHQVDIVRAFVKGLKHFVKFRKIGDITVLKGEDTELVPSKAANAGGDPRPRSILIHLLDGSLRRIDTNGCGANYLAKRIKSAWQSSLVLRSAQLSKLNTAADIAMADEYLSETINSLKLISANCKSSVGDRFEQQIEIFNEFANEVLVDLELKEITCRSREFFFFSLILCKELMLLPSSRSIPILDRSVRIRSELSVDNSTDNVKRNSYSSIITRQSTSSNLFIREISGVESRSELQIQLHATALQRLNLIRAALKAMASVLFCSESSSSRNSLLGGPNPLTLDSWCPLLESDLYLEICKNIGCESETEEDQVQAAMKQSHLFQPKTIRSVSQSKSVADVKSPYYPHGTAGSRSPAVSSLWKQSTGDLVSEVILTPVKEKIKMKSKEIDFFTPTLADTRRGVRDLQIIISLELARIAAIGQCTLSRNLGFSYNPQVPSFPSNVLLFGETYVRQTNWEQSLENLLLRVSTLLDDMLCSAAITTKMLDISMTSRCGSIKLSNRSIDGAAFFDRRLSKQPDRSKDRFRDFSPAVTSRPSKMSPSMLSSKKDDWSCLTPAKSGQLSDGDARPHDLRLTVPGSFDALRPGTCSPGPCTPMSASFDFGVDLASLSSRRATVPPSPIPRHRGKDRDGDWNDGLQYPPRSRKSTRNLHWTDEDAERDRNESRCPLETQEILLFYTLALLQTMALDSAKVRKVLGQDLSGYWLPIMQIFNTICPRPLSPKDPEPVLDVKNEQSMGVSSSNSSMMTGIFSNNYTKRYPHESLDDLMYRKTSYFGLFRSKAPTDITNTAVPQEDLNEAKTINKTSANNSSDWKTKLLPQIDDNSDLLLSDYGAPLYGMSSASWTLLILARRSAEQMVIMFGLHESSQERIDGEPVRESVPFRLKELTALQVQNLNKQRDEAEAADRKKNYQETTHNLFMNHLEESDGDDSQFDLCRGKGRNGTRRGGVPRNRSKQNKSRQIDTLKTSSHDNIPNSCLECPSPTGIHLETLNSPSLEPPNRIGRKIFRRAHASTAENDAEVSQKINVSGNISPRSILSKDLPARNIVDSPRQIATISYDMKNTTINSIADHEENSFDEDGDSKNYGFRSHSRYVSNEA